MTLTYRPINIGGLTTKPLDDQTAPVLEWIAIDRLVIDDRYQRPLGQRNWQTIRKIADGFRWSAFGPVLVAPVQGGLFAVIDGQHRVHAAMLRQIERVPAMIAMIPQAEQADSFTRINTIRVNITPHQAYRAAREAGEPTATAARDAVAAAGCTLATANPSAKDKLPGVVYPVGLIRQMVTQGKAAAITATLTAIRAFDTTGRVPLYSDYILRPLVTAVAATSPPPDADLILAALRRADPFKVLDAAEIAARRDGKSVSAAGRAAFEYHLRRQALTSEAVE